jgi:hypothetical protein
MDRQLLERYLRQGLSLPQIGALVDRDPSTVGYWVQKHRLVANGREKYAARGGLTREELEPLVESGATLEQMALAVHRSVATVRYWLEKHALEGGERRGPRRVVSRGEAKAALDAGLRTVTAHCLRHGDTVFVIENSGRARCRKCRMSGWPSGDAAPSGASLRRPAAAAGSAGTTAAWPPWSFTTSIRRRSPSPCPCAA